MTSHTDKLVMVMASLHEGGLVEFDEWTLSVRAWEMFPDTYGLRGYRDTHPDHKIVCNAYQKGSKSAGPIRDGYMVRVRENHYRVLPRCLKRARELSQSSDESEGSDVKPMDQPSWERLWRARASSAVRFYQDNDEASPDWNDVEAFLEISVPPDRAGLGGGRKAGRAKESENNGRVVSFHAILTDALNSGEITFRKTAAGGGRKKELTNADIVAIVNTFNANISQWNSMIERVGVMTPIQYIIEVE